MVPVPINGETPTYSHYTRNNDAVLQTDKIRTIRLSTVQNIPSYSRWHTRLSEDRERRLAEFALIV
jgi:hypothetical protein